MRSWPRTFTVNSDPSFCILTDVQELCDDDVIGRAAVHKEQVMMAEAHICETFGVVHFLVETDDGGDVVLPEVREIGFRGVKRVSWWRHKFSLFLNAVQAQKRLSAAGYSFIFYNNSGRRLVRIAVIIRDKFSTHTRTHRSQFCFLDEDRWRPETSLGWSS